MYSRSVPSNVDNTEVLTAAHTVPVVMNPFIRPCAWDSDSSSPGEVVRRHRCRKIATYTDTSALAEVKTSLDAAAVALENHQTATAPFVKER
jgi:hypothetical protein